MSTFVNTLRPDISVALKAEGVVLAKSGTGSCSLPVYLLFPLEDARWDPFLERHPNASVFHSSAWLKALQQTYGYEVVAYTTSPSTQSLEDAIVFCRVNSWLTGRRSVSLPFSDHCEPLLSEEGSTSFLKLAMKQEFGSHQSRYVEFRPLQLHSPEVTPRTEIPYVFHQLDLSPDLETLFDKFHKSSIQRKIRKAENQGLQYGEGRTELLLDEFYKLFKGTRKRHRVPPQPRRWFLNLMQCFGDSMKIRVSYKGERPVAAMITLQHKDTLIYKYGASDLEFHRFGAMHLLYWRAIQEAKTLGLRRFDLGRTDADQPGLITFKNRWGTARSTLTYSRHARVGSSTHFFDFSSPTRWKTQLAKRVVSCLPYRVVSEVGQMLYRHIA